MFVRTSGSMYPSNAYCNFTQSANDTVLFNGKTRQQTYLPVASSSDTNCTVCLKLGCVWCSHVQSSQPGYCYNGQYSQYCNGQDDNPIDHPSTCNNEVTLIVFLLTIFLGIVLPLCLILGCFSCIIYFAHRYLKSRRSEQQVIPIEAECNAVVELQPYHDVRVYTYVDVPVLINSSQSQPSFNNESKDSEDNRIVHVTATPIYS